MENRRRGTLIGLAVGDALGAAVEFRSPGSFPPVIGYRDGGPHGLAAGEWTDDTSMALALADSIITTGWDLNDQANRYLEWWRSGKYSVNGKCFDIGITTQRALSHFKSHKDSLSSGDTSEGASGNGSIMRLGPVLSSPHGHCLEIITSPYSFYGVPVTPWLVLYRDQETDEVVGCLVELSSIFR